MGIVPKGPRANVRDITTARERKGGRPSGLGYDPATGAEHASANYRDPNEQFKPHGKRSYSEDRFYTRAVNDNDHGERRSIRLPQGFDSQLDEIVREVPEYRHLNDMIRDALVHRAEYINKRYKLSAEAQRWLDLLRFRADSDRREQDSATMEAAVEDIKAKLDKAWGRKDFGMFAMELDEAEHELIDWLRTPYKEEVVALVKDWKQRAKGELERERARRDE